MRAAAVLLVALPFVAGAVATAADVGPDAEEAARFADPAITESSGLAVLGEGWVTVNDSGDGARIFVVDPATGETVRTVTYAETAVDVEALSPEGDDVVWVGDIGDNFARREHVSLYRVPLDGSPVSRLDVRYDDGPRDAETLVRDPATGSLWILTKGVLGGAAYRVPDSGEGVRVAERAGDVPALLTDGSFTASGDAVLARNYTRGFRIEWPSLEVTATLALPRQEQGESLGIEPGGDVLIGSEGAAAPVLRLPAQAWDASRSTPGTPSPSTEVSPPARETPTSTADGGSGGPSAWGWWAIAAGAVGAVGLGAAWWVRGRPRRDDK